MRRILRPLFVPRAVAAPRARDPRPGPALVAGWGDGTSVDLARQLAWPLPLSVISSLLAIPPRTGATARAGDGVRDPRRRRGDAVVGLARCAHRAQGIFPRARDRAPPDRRRRRVDHAIAHAGESAPLRDDDLILICLLLFVAGSETTAGDRGRILALESHHDQARTLARRPQQIPARSRRSSATTRRSRARPDHDRGRRVPRPDDPRGPARVPAVRVGQSRRPALHRAGPAQAAPAAGAHARVRHGIHFCLGVHLARLEDGSCWRS